VDQPAPLTKSNLVKSEATLNTLAALGAVLATYFAKNPGVLRWLAPAMAVTMAVVYALFHTPLVGDHKPGWKTKTCWVSMATVVASGAAAISESDIAGIPAKVVQIAGLLAAGLTAMGYTIWRYGKKVGGS
jgi:hypothetical protein